MPKSEKEDPLELMHRAVAAFDAQIAELQAQRASVAALLGPTATAPTTPPKKHGMSDEARAKISAAAKQRWAQKRSAATAPTQEPTPPQAQAAPAPKATVKATTAATTKAPAKVQAAPAKPAKPKKASPKKAAAATAVTGESEQTA